MNSQLKLRQLSEFVTAQLASSSAVNVPNDTATDITSILLQAGDWDIYGTVLTLPDAGTVTIFSVGWVNSASVTQPPATSGGLVINGYTTTAGFAQSIFTGILRQLITAPTRFYLSTFINIGGGAMHAYGVISARRRR